MRIDRANWSGDGDFTTRVIEVLTAMPSVAALRVEDAPASRADAGYSFISNEIFVTFRVVTGVERRRWLGVVPVTRRTDRPELALVNLEAQLATLPDVGAPDYGDEGMLQYLRTERIVPRYQAKGYKLVELLRIYEAGRARRDGDEPPPDSTATAGSR